MRQRNRLYKLILSAMFLAVALLLPLLTGQIKQIGNALCPMHIPVLLCGFFCGPLYALAVGVLAPILRLVLFGMPPFIPSGIGMCFELAAYGFTAGLLYRLLPRKRAYIYVSLVCAMLVGRIVWGAVRAVLYGVAQQEFGWAIFMSSAFVKAVPGIVIQLVLVPVLVMLLEKRVK